MPWITKPFLNGRKNRKDCAIEELREKSLEETRHLREFKTAGTRGILECEIESLILPLLADHVLQEANHYIRILQHGYEWQGGLRGHTRGQIAEDRVHKG